MDARAAYEFLTDGLQQDSASEIVMEHADSGAGMRRPAAVTRPRIMARVDPIDPDILNECYLLLARQDGAAAADHVPVKVIRSGRELVFSVPTRLEKGTNRVALPTTMLGDPARHAPTILTCVSKGAGPGDIEVPEGIRIRVFPGARIVRIRFGKD